MQSQRHKNKMKKSLKRLQGHGDCTLRTGRNGGRKPDCLLLLWLYVEVQGLAAGLMSVFTQLYNHSGVLASFVLACCLADVNLQRAKVLLAA